ncbi:FG-GAP-like repeat-containing protein [Winogradskyella sp. SYSU M77433]|uniref:FG-GAP-like repeat-containing protein n=1 Tax=Winogradskyella sp. SYSU M77433 TaxID=3042722 RepID=UPI002480107A|nr:FG-GAP-like repeat-containing protein [Winogradskyella sp. SYSU M77433]MDH7914033.1 FG-GAP-like repeat-containing protein [Winogradskyella sp. SYSU M77433]
MKFRNVCLLVSFLFVNISISQVSFNDLATNLGINAPCGNTFLGNGITFFDYDNDGWDDITIASAQGYSIRFYKNINGNFVLHSLNIEDDNSQTKQINWVDIDNDGDNDLFVTSDTSGVKLYENLGNMIMENITDSCGMLSDIFPYYGASWGDYNNDGFLDVFLSIRSQNIPNILYKNNGDNTFTIVNTEVGLLSNGFMSFCSAFFDYDNDGDQDIYVSNDKENYPNLMYRNNGDNTFTEVGALTGTAIGIDAMSVTIDDINSDGWLDIFVTNDDTDSVLLLNNTDGTFTDVAISSQVTFNSLGWGAVFLDADNDKDLDLYISGETDGSNPEYLSSAFYINNNDGTFSLNNASVPNDFANSYSNAIGDLDNDGYSEIAVNHINHTNISLWKNISQENNNNWLKIKLEGTIGNRNGIGSLVEISINGEKQYRYTLCGEGYLSQNSATEIFGLGNDLQVDYVKVKWLSGVEDILYNVSANQQLNITEASTLSLDPYSNTNFLIFPNPVKNIIYVNSKTIIETIIIYNTLGKEVFKTSTQDYRYNIDLSNFKSGIYFIKAINSYDNKTVKILKL